MSKNFDVIALGELLIDFTENGISGQGNPMFEANPGGAPCNVLAMLNKLRKKTSFLGVVGKDQFGTALRASLDELGIDTSHLYEDEEVHTTLAFVHTFEDGDRDFAFYRNPGADMMLCEEQIEEEYIKSAQAIHYGTLSMTHEGVRKATYKAIEIARKNGLLISFDPNLRPPLWKTLDEAKEQISYGLSKCDLLKISEEELEFMTGTKDVKEGAHILLEKYHNIKLMNVTMGKEGSIAFHEGKEVFQAPFLQEKTIETTGAGDTFGACALNYVLENGIEGLSEAQLQEMLCFANGASSLITTKKGALRVMPEKEEVEEFIASRK
ncbi:carbohydrate kinase family protein [Blautia sp. Marseille-P3201T]|uniref:carbohydrate kinase family protein n=1 Tax=Blautia sp. Marseille-P3201T TaxID=1907659 RepID=UPI000931C34C|nr:carbohydrate kinase [Blautia sp. Marseille-P3201T]